MPLAITQPCMICGGRKFKHEHVLWDHLVETWQLSPEETAYIDRQQGTRCTRCRASLRTIALAGAIAAQCGSDKPLVKLLKAAPLKHMSLLDINGAGVLSRFLKKLRGHALRSWPDVDIHALPYKDGELDMIIHSDTLEHVENPVHALAECRRALKPGGALCFTVPIVVERMTRSRSGLPPSYHGNETTRTDDLIVRTEFGADMWTHVMKAGFTTVSLNSFDYPAAIAIRAVK